MVDQIDIAQVLFLDIETVSGKSSWGELPEAMQELWRHKSQSLAGTKEPLSDEDTAQWFQDRAAIYAEFGKIICISVGIVYRDREDKSLRVRLKSFANDDERVLLQEFADLLKQYYPDPKRHFLCGHNIKEFDVPYMCRRMVVNQLAFPTLLDISGKKPWETAHLVDTMELWKFGDRKSYTSLKLLAATLDFPSPKDDIDGSQVGRVYWDENDLDRIALYCEKDVLATIQLFQRFKREPILEEHQVSHVGR